MAIDWIAIEGAYRAGEKSLRAIAEEYGTVEGTIRSRAKKHGWARNPEAIKRGMVKAAMSGVTQGVTQNAMREIEDAAAQDVADMQAALAVARACVQRLRGMAEKSEDPKEVKVIAEANNIATGTIRRIRGLDDTPADAGTVQVAVIIPHKVAVEVAA